MRAPLHVDPRDVSLPTILSALSDPLRLQIVALLAEQGETECSTIYSTIGVSKTNASHHFRVLREAGLIWRCHDGRKQTAQLRTDEVNDRFPGLLATVLDNLEHEQETAVHSTPRP
ncbi:ArsR family transcriptional regulator [Mycolicibacterium sp. CH28]|uniref:ArsR/SmtB family transcription factor n=1 Tax=Mycolicibacterium sp. CH28 TaxID=2512237 RepID=UPI001080D2C4|nr:metalloregulator ArsR/SmtB family transcription factor [Mycolicibacterium sp. CH28]TGD89994.1 ArsR family transcriptional regulator [Mycolicibacterium sp. CH28]